MIPMIVKMVKYWKFIEAMIWPVNINSRTVTVETSDVSLKSEMK